ncbi:hypothetical protein GRI62_02860 [Erythrobacter arachoides]|uniref:Phage shock protein B n=1 Tax=Aurantiacibacter arachoides TaxID=1850444 RepID=A0A844ZXC6_9SPHN|nr:hypothetical protein [Aurantiacibacter arachoides]MXO92545.1 hypothetical protein [Aurantiacibacter arachoides]GGD56336.1 hypothetical protein GCM10011411_15430 [Aurantiacibacter arachoides]
MNPDMLLVFGFVLAMILIVFPFGYFINKREQEHKERKLEIQARIEEAKATQAVAPNEVQAHLEDRLRVLERIVTDPGMDISRQIEALRAETRSAR